MRKMKRRAWIGILTGALVAGGLAGCGNSSDSGSTASSGSSESTASASSASSAANGEKLKVGCVVKFQHEFYSTLMEGAEDACEELGLEFTGQAPQAADDVDGQVQMVEDMVTSGVDILMVAPNQESTLYNAFDMAVDDGTMIIAVDTDLTDYENKTAFVGTDNYEALYTAGEMLAEQLPEGSNVIILRGALGDANHEKRAAGATAALEDNGMNVLECFDAGSTAEGAAAAMDDFLTKYAGKIDAVLCCGDDMASGAVNSLKQAGELDNILVSGYDGLDIGIQAVADGDLCFDLSQNPYQMGYQAVKVAYAAYCGEDYEESTDTGVQAITPDNVSEWQ